MCGRGIRIYITLWNVYKLLKIFYVVVYTEYQIYESNSFVALRHYYEDNRSIFTWKFRWSFQYFFFLFLSKQMNFLVFLNLFRLIPPFYTPWKFDFLIWFPNTGLKWAKEIVRSQPAITCSKLKIETLEQGVKYVQS